MNGNLKMHKYEECILKWKMNTEEIQELKLSC